MALLVKRGTCEALTPLLQFKRFRAKINIQKPKPPHFDKAKYLALTKPWFPSNRKNLAPADLCTKDRTPPYKAKQDENLFQQIIAEELKRWFTSSKLIAFFHSNPMSREEQLNAFIALKKEKMHMKQYGKETLTMAIKGTPYESVLDFYVSHNMMVFSPEPEIKKLLRILKKFPQLVLLAGIYENRFLSKEDLLYYSTVPNLQAAQAGLVHTLNSVGSQIVSNLNASQSSLVSNLEQRADQLKE